MYRRIILLAFLYLVASSAVAQSPGVGSCSVFPADNIWNTPVDQLAVSPNSSTYINTIGSTLPVHADFGSGLYNGEPIGIPFVTVPGTQTKYPATFLYATESDPGPYAVPLNAPIEGGSQSTGDRHAIAIDVNNCVLFELYRAFPQTSSWQADSGAIFNLLSDGLRTSTWTSADAAGLPMFPGLVRYDEIAAGEIRHAIRFTVPKTQRAFVWPARHYASSLTDPKYPPMGVRFRLRADFDISGFSATNQIILKALKKYGMTIADNGSAWYISGAPDSRWDNSDLHNLGRVTGTNFEVADVSSLMLDPNSGQTRQTTIAVTVAPPSANVTVNATKQFSASVASSTDQTVTWAVNGTVGGNSSVGWIGAAGLYTAPGVVPSSSVTIQAISHAMSSAIGTAGVTIIPSAPPVSVTVSPATASVRVGQTKQYSALVQNSTSQSVTWKVNGIAGGNTLVGAISANGLYTAPSSVPSPNQLTVTAISAADPSAFGSATVTVTILRRRR